MMHLVDNWYHHTKRMTKTSADKFETEVYLRFKKNEKAREERFAEFEKGIAEREKERAKLVMQRQREREEMEQDDFSTSDEETEESDDDEDDDTIYCQICSKKYDDFNKRTGPKGDRSCHSCCADCFRQCTKIKRNGNYYSKQYTCFWCEGIHYFEPTSNEIFQEREKEKKRFEYNHNIQNNKQAKKETCEEETTDSGCLNFLLFILFICFMMNHIKIDI